MKFDNESAIKEAVESYSKNQKLIDMIDKCHNMANKNNSKVEISRSAYDRA